MTSSEWDGTPWGGSPASPAKGISGPYASRVEYGTYLNAVNRTPQARMRDAQALYHANPWIRTAEGVVTRRTVGLDWHLETADDEEVPENASGALGDVMRLLERPQANLENVGRKMTRRELWSITSRHIGLCGMAYWYLDGISAASGIPLGIIYINPARMWCATDDAGNLTGWILDAKDAYGRGGTPLTLEEVLPFYLDPPDAGFYGSGLVEAAWQKAQITTLADRHAAYILGTGGRLPGIVSPKEGTIPDEAYKALVAEFRNVNEAPDAAKRTTVVRGPIEFTNTSADPGDLLLLDISRMNRDDIFSVWGVPPSQAGVSGQTVGLNSGETRRYEEAILMQGAVHDRVVSLTETIQYGLLDRWQGAGVEVDLEIEEPEFDDDTPAYENAQRAVNIPLTNAERRAIIGLDPTGDEAVDNAILLPLTLTPFDASPPEPAPPPQMPSQMPMEQGMKAAGSRAFLGLRRKMEARFVPTLRRSLAGVLREQRLAIANRVREQGEKIARKPGDTTLWWDPKREDDRLAKVLRAGNAAIAQTVARQVGHLMETPKKASPERRQAAPAGTVAAGAATGAAATSVAFEDTVLSYVLRRTGERITEINATTRDAVAAAIAQGIDEGLSPAQLGDLIEGLPAFDEYRGELVARTETMLAYNDAALTSYGEFGVERVIAIDGDQDEECAARDGQEYSREESYDIIDHPNGTLDWAPVVGRAYWDEPAKAEPEQRLRIEVGEPPIINVPAPVVNVAAPVVNVDMSEMQGMAAALKAVLDRKPMIIRDEHGRIVGLEMVTGGARHG
jgi:phage portal protein BeeE